MPFNYKMVLMIYLKHNIKYSKSGFNNGNFYYNELKCIK